jgi:hypothetical protein
LDIAYPTFQAVSAEKFVPAIADDYLAKNGYLSQMTEKPVSPQRKDNLWEPVDEDRGAHGSFDDQSHRSSVFLWATLHRKEIALAGVLGWLGYRALKKAA